jgi:hypothetical protein
MSDAIKLSTQNAYNEVKENPQRQKELPTTDLTTHSNALSSISHDQMMESLRSLQPESLLDATG